MGVDGLRAQLEGWRQNPGLRWKDNMISASDTARGRRKSRTGIP